MTDEHVDLWSMLAACKVLVTDTAYNDYQARTALEQISMMQDKACAYLWGREDEAGTKVKYAYGREIIDAGWEYSHMVAIMVAMSYIDGISRWPRSPNLRDTYAAFRAGTDLRDYVNSPWPQ
jgi:hypothetical protein